MPEKEHRKIIQVEKEKQEKSEISKEILEKAKEIEPKLLEYYADFHRHPELGGEEYKTAAQVKKILTELGVEIVGECIGGTGIVAHIRGREGGEAVALRADMDALPIQEDESHELKSENPGVMHACGHDAHTSGLLGAAEILQKLSSEGKLPGDVILLFQPSEERVYNKRSGAVQIIKFLEKEGLRDQIKAFFGLHVASKLERGTVNLKEGVEMASSGEINIKLTGPGGHIMNAYELPNLHVIFSEITVRLRKIFEPLADKKEALVASPATTYNGEYNVLSSEADSTWVIRVTSPNYKKISSQITEKIKRVISEVLAEEKVEGEVTVEIKRQPGYRPLIHRDPELVKLARDSAGEVIDNLKVEENVLLGGEDFAFYLEKLRDKEIPGAFVMVGAANSEKGITPGSHHTSDFKIDQGVIADLAALYSDLAVRALAEYKHNK